MPQAPSPKHEDASFDPKTTSCHVIRDHIEQIAKRIYDFINGPAAEDDPIVYHISPSGIETTVCGGNRRRESMDQAEFMRGMNWLKTEYPNFHIEVETLEVVVNINALVNKQYKWRNTYGLAEVWANCTATGGPGYLNSTKRYVNLFEYRFEAGRWVCTKEMVIDGMPAVV